MTTPIRGKYFDKYRNGNMTFELAPTTNIKRLRVYVDRVLEAIGHPEALVTDESMVRDFYDLSEVPGSDFAKDELEIVAMTDRLRLQGR